MKQCERVRPNIKHTYSEVSVALLQNHIEERNHHVCNMLDTSYNSV